MHVCWRGGVSVYLNLRWVYCGGEYSMHARIGEGVDIDGHANGVCNLDILDAVGIPFTYTKLDVKLIVGHTYSICTCLSL